MAILDGATVTTAELNYLDITTLGTQQASKAVTTNASNIISSFESTGIDDNATSTAITIDSSEKVALGGSTAVTSDSQVAIHGGNLELTTAGSKYWIARASDGALTGSLYSPSGSAVRLSGAGTSSGTIEFEPSSSSGVAMTIDNSGRMEISSSDADHQLKITTIGTNANGVIDFNSPGTGGAVIQVAGSEKLRINSSGNVGIGTSNPQSRIDVGGGYMANEQGRTDHVANTMPSPYYNFDGDSDYINCGATVADDLGNGNYSIHYRCRLESTNSGEQYILSKQDGGANYYGWRFGFNNGVIRHSIHGTSAAVEHDESTDYRDGKVHDYVFTLNSDQTELNTESPAY